VAAVNFLRVSSVAVFTCAASLAMTLTACGGSDNEAQPTTTSTSTTDIFTPPSLTQTAPEDAACPMVAPTGNPAPEWTLSGTTGSVAVTGSTDKASPRIDVEAPFSVAETQVQTLKPGDGPVVADTATVLVCYMGVNGRDGSVFDSSYAQGAPVDFPLNGVVAGFQKAIAGQKVGSTVAVAMTPADGYPEGQPSAGIQPGDSLIFAIKILDAST
jgi:FKBP-type peptidyl-prolyl cis-trans isomerase